MLNISHLLKFAFLHLFFILFYLNQVQAQSAIFPKKDSLLKKIQPYAILQIWSVYTQGEKADLDADGIPEAVDDRLSFMFRRARVGLKGEAFKNLRYNFSLFYDNLGKDDFDALRAPSNNNREFGLWDAQVNWKVLDKSTLLYLTTGFFRPQVSRASMTAPFVISSFEKAQSQFYTRQFQTGRNFGRAMGINVGGAHHPNKVGFDYNLGLFTPRNTSGDATAGPNSTGVKWSPLVAARFALAIGDPEKGGYSLGYVTNYYSQRNGVVLGLGGTYQGATDQFTQSQMLSVDLLANFGIFNLDAEWNYMERKNELANFPSHTWHVRTSLNILLKNKTMLEPNLMYSFFSGATGAETVGFFDGRDLMWNVGINWYLKKKALKLSLHYTDQDGFGNRNQYTFQNGRAVLKGDYWGLGLQVFI